MEKTGLLAYTHDHLTLISGYGTPEYHSHLSPQLTAAAGGILHCVCRGEEFDAEAVLIASDVPHTITGSAGNMLVCLFENTGSAARNSVAKLLDGRDHIIFGSETARKAGEILADKISPSEKDAAILSAFGISDEIPADNTDGRVTEMLRIISSLETIPPDAADLLAGEIHLSKSRMSHIFSQNMGISLHRYLAFVKMKKAFGYINGGDNFTDAAVRAGFDTPSHMASTCRRMFGISMSELKNSMK